MTLSLPTTTPMDIELTQEMRGIIRTGAEIESMPPQA
jgi:hypothetical protein